MLPGPETQWGASRCCGHRPGRAELVLLTGGARKRQVGEALDASCLPCPLALKMPRLLFGVLVGPVPASPRGPRTAQVSLNPAVPTQRSARRQVPSE